MTRLGRVILFAQDVERLAAFYEQGLGLTVVGERAPRWLRLDAGGVELALHGVHVVATGEPRTDTPVKVVFLVEDMQAARTRLVAAGGRMRDVRDVGDYAICDGVDPEGNVFQIATG